MSKKVVVTVLGQDCVGIVARIATVLAENQVNIEDINQKILGGSIFAMTMLTDLANCPLPLADLSRRLEAAGEDLGLKVMTQDAEVFRYMHRV